MCISINNIIRIITNELNLQVRPTSVSKLGKGYGGRPAPLLLKFSTSDDAASVIKSDKNLRTSTDNDIKSSVFISPDYTKLERHEQFILRSELHRRRAAGENNLIIRNGSIFTRRQTPCLTDNLRHICVPLTALSHDIISTRMPTTPTYVTFLGLLFYARSAANC